jgi:hypothetical protein
MAKGDAASQRLLDALKKAHSEGKVLCPIHLEETIFESAALPDDLRGKLFDLVRLLSDGFAFHSIAARVRYATMQMLVGDFAYNDIWECGLNIKTGTDFKSLAADLKWTKEDYNERVNHIPYPPTSYKVGQKGDDIYKNISSERAYSFWRILEAIRDKGSLVTGRDEWELAVIVGEHLAGLPIAPRHCNELIECIKHHKWDCIPYLYVHARVGAQIELQCLSGRRKMTANDQLDLSRVAVGLNDAKIVLCDTAMANFIRDSKVLDICKDVIVYSMKEQDEAAEYIEKL